LKHIFATHQHQKEDKVKRTHTRQEEMPGSCVLCKIALESGRLCAGCEAWCKTYTNPTPTLSSEAAAAILREVEGGDAQKQ